MDGSALLITAKIQHMEEQIKFLEPIWNKLSRKDKDRYLNNFSGKVPDKYNS